MKTAVDKTKKRSRGREKGSSRNKNSVLDVFRHYATYASIPCTVLDNQNYSV